MPAIKELINSTARSVDSTAKNPQSADRVLVAGQVLDIFYKKRAMRDQKQELFRDRTLVQYLNDNVKRFIQFKRRPAYKKKWQSNLASSTPNEKLIGILSKLATKGIESRVVSLGDLTAQTMLRERVLNGLMKKAAIKNDDDFQIILEMLEAASKGTVFGLEDWYHGKAKIKEVISQDPETGELEFTEKTIKRWNDVRSQLIAIEDFYPGNLNVRPGKVQDMDECFLRTKMDEDEFEEQFGGYPDADLVSTVSSLVNDSTPFWKQSNDVGKNEIEVLRYFNKKKDEFVILANGIWINPIGKATISPLPWNHKQLPVWGGVFEPLDSNFLYGRSFIDKLISMVDSKDALFDRILDQMTLAVSKPIIASPNIASALTKGFLQPDNVIEVDWSNGKPQFELAPINDPSPASITLYQLLQQNAEQVLAAETIGGRSVRKKTATEATIEQEGAQQVISLFLTFMEKAMRDKHRLRLANLLQFYSMPIHTDSEGAKFRKVVLRNEQLSNGKTGVLTVDILSEVNQQRVIEKGRQTNLTTEFIEITPTLLRNFEGEDDVEIVQQSSIKMTEVQRQILEANYQKLMMELYPDKFNRDAGFDSMVRVFGKDPVIQKTQQQQEPGMLSPMAKPLTSANIPALV